MVKKFLLSLVVLCAVLLLVAGGAYWFREPLIRFGVNRALAASEISLIAVEGLRFERERVQLAQLALILPSGQRLDVSEIDLRFFLPSFRVMPALQSLDVGALHLGPAEAEPEESEASSELRLSEVLDLLRALPLSALNIDELVVPQWHEPLRVELQSAPGQVHLDVASGALHLLAEFTQADENATAQLQAALTRAQAELGELLVTLLPQDEDYLLDGRGRLVFEDLAALLGEFQASTTLDLLAFQAPLQSADLNWTLNGRIADDLHGTLSNTTARSFVVGLDAGSTFALPTGFVENLGSATVRFPNALNLTFTTGAGMGISNAVVPLEVRSSYQEDAIAVNGTLQLGECLLDVDAPCSGDFHGDVVYGDYGVNGALDFVLPSARGGVGTYRVKSQDLVLRGLPPDVPPFDIDATVTLTDSGLSFSTPLTLRGTPAPLAPTASGSYGFENQTLEAKLTLPELEFNEEGRGLSNWVSNWSYPADVLAGKVEALELEVLWRADAPLNAKVKADLQQLGGFYEAYFFSGLSGVVEAEVSMGDTLTVTTAPMSLQLADIDVGVPITNVQLEIEIERSTQAIVVPSFSAEVVGGTLSGKDLRYDPNAAGNSMTLYFTGLDLAQMLEQIEYKGVQATGKLSGEIPVTIGTAGVVVAGGSLRADAPGGTLRYFDGGAAAAAGNAQLDLVNQVLSNFQYHTLTSTIDYTVDGELQLGMQLQGHNPDLGSDQPINLNLNLTDDIPALLQSLRAARDIEQFLQEQYRNVLP